MGEDLIHEGIHILPQNTVNNLGRSGQLFAYGELQNQVGNVNMVSFAPVCLSVWTYLYGAVKYFGLQRMSESM